MVIPTMEHSMENIVLVGLPAQMILPRQVSPIAPGLVLVTRAQFVAGFGSVVSTRSPLVQREREKLWKKVSVSAEGKSIKSPNQF